MRLLDLQPAFIIIRSSNKLYREIDELEHAQGVRFLCPKCFQDNGGMFGTHYVCVWFEERDVPMGEEPPTRWSFSGRGYDTLTISPSIQLTSGCKWHGLIQDGEIIFG